MVSTINNMKCFNPIRNRYDLAEVSFKVLQYKLIHNQGYIKLNYLHTLILSYKPSQITSESTYG